ncbi:MAG: polysaccharide deacetylase family protein [Lachnospiraceae bacterium]
MNVKDTVLSDGSQMTEKESAGTVYLTFDDGPSENTERVLDILKEYDAVATFFLIGDSATEDYSDVIKRMIEEGHAVGLHCSCHNYNKVYEDTSSCVESILSEREYLRNQFGIESSICRLPGGSTNRYIKNKDSVVETLHSEGLKIFDWTVSAEDSVGVPTAESIMKNIFPEVYNQENAIILMHDGVCNGLTADLLPQILERLTEYGYKFGSLDEREEFFYK